jgi:hypothetical protein
MPNCAPDLGTKDQHYNCCPHLNMVHSEGMFALTACEPLLDLEKPYLQHPDPGLGKARGVNFIPVYSATRNPRSEFVAALVL